MKRKFLTFLACSFLLTGCNSNQIEVNNFLLMPSGAPTLALYEEVATNKELVVTTNPNEVKDNFVSNNYKYLVFDAINGINFAKNNKSNYEFVTLLTGGNFHLVGINKTINDIPEESDYIVGFGNENLIPNKVFSKLYNVKTDNLFASVTDLNSYLMSINEEGKVNNQIIDWIFIAQPALFSLKNNSSSFSKLYSNSIDINIRELFKEKYNINYIPQAGLFVNKNYLNSNGSDVESFKNKVDIMKNDALYNIDKVKSSMNSYSNDLKVQQSRYGFNENIAYNLQKDGQNEFGIVDPKDNFTIEDINSFLNILK